MLFERADARHRLLVGFTQRFELRFELLNLGSLARLLVALLIDRLMSPSLRSPLASALGLERLDGLAKRLDLRRLTLEVVPKFSELGAVLRA